MGRVQAAWKNVDCVHTIAFVDVELFSIATDNLQVRKATTPKNAIVILGIARDRGDKFGELTSSSHSHSEKS